jgi:hypothetical protein
MIASTSKKIRKPIDYDEPRFEGLSKKKVKKLLKSENYNANKHVWKKEKRDQKKQRRVQAKLLEKNADGKETIEKDEETVKDEPEKEFKLKKRDFRKLVMANTKEAPIVIIDASFEDALDKKVK